MLLCKCEWIYRSVIQSKFFFSFFTFLSSKQKNSSTKVGKWFYGHCAFFCCYYNKRKQRPFCSIKTKHLLQLGLADVAKWNIKHENFQLRQNFSWVTFSPGTSKTFHFHRATRFSAQHSNWLKVIGIKFSIFLSKWKLLPLEGLDELFSCCSRGRFLCGFFFVPTDLIVTREFSSNIISKTECLMRSQLDVKEMFNLLIYVFWLLLRLRFNIGMHSRNARPMFNGVLIQAKYLRNKVYEMLCRISASRWLSLNEIYFYRSTICGRYEIKMRKFSVEMENEKLLKRASLWIVCSSFKSLPNNNINNKTERFQVTI